VEIRVLLFVLLLPQVVYGAKPIEEITPEAAGYDSEKLGELYEVADSLYMDGRIPNYVIALYKDQKRFFTASRGKTRLEGGADPRLPAGLAEMLKGGSSVGPATIFHMASMSKPIVTTGLLRLVEEGKVSLDDPLSKFFPDFAQMMVAPEGDFNNQFEPAKREILVLDLIRHTSGFSYPERIAGFGDVGKLYGELGIFDDRSRTMAEHMSTLSEVPLVAHPGEAFYYSVSVDVIGAIIEKVSGKDLSSFLSQEIFEPLSMESTGFTIAQQNLSNASDIYGSQPYDPSLQFSPLGRLSDGSIDWKIQNVIPAAFFQQSPAFYSGGGGILSTADDYARYLTMIANDGTFEGSRILDQQSLETHTKPLISDISALARAFGDAAQYMTFGGGFGIKNEPKNLEQVDYYFWAGAFNTFFWIDPSDRSIGLFLTAHWPVQYNISDRLEQIVDEARVR
jgi:CubicO group peptidase (beta-lactamase class C family)